MRDKTVKAGQFFTLLFVGRVSLMMLYSSSVSGVENAGSFIFPFLIFIPTAVLISIPSAAVSLTDGKRSLCSCAVSEFGFVGKGISLLYSVYFVFSAFFSIALFRDFLSEALPFGANSQILLAAVTAGCAFAAVRGIEAASRLSLPVLVLVIVCFALMFVFLFGGFSSGGLPSREVISFSTAADCIVFLMSRMNGIAVVNSLSHHVKGNIRRGTVVFWILYSVSACAAIILFSGSAGAYLSGQHLQSFKAIDGSGVLQRLAPLFILAAVCSLFCNVSLCLIAASESMSLAIKKVSVKKAALICAAAAYIGVLILPDETIRAVLSSTKVTAAGAVFFIFVLPLCVRIYRAAKKTKAEGSSAVGRKRAKLYMLFVLIVFVTLSLSGCGSLQLDQRLIIQGIGMDRSAGSYRLTAVVLDTKDPEQENKSAVIYSEGETAEKALEQLEEQRGKRLLLSHCLFIMMNGYAAEESRAWLTELTDKYGASKTAELMVSEGSSEKLISQAVREFGYSAEDISVITDSRAVRQRVRNVSLFDYISAANKGEISITLPYIITDNGTKSLRAEEISVAGILH